MKKYIQPQTKLQIIVFESHILASSQASLNIHGQDEEVDDTNAIFSDSKDSWTNEIWDD
ncbi:hypothetical protein EVA_00501 [gut metagenome]|uniref:Uncharacterized protein n=1 Tax=gut metagenome TaxID=749906 RepID=J9GS70_9ZZZZ